MAAITKGLEGLRSLWRGLVKAADVDLSEVPHKELGWAMHKLRLGGGTRSDVLEAVEKEMERRGLYKRWGTRTGSQYKPSPASVKPGAKSQVLKTQKIEQQPKTQQQTDNRGNVFKGMTNHSGGAFGADSQFDTIGREFGLTDHRHYYSGRKTPKGNRELTTAEKDEGVVEMHKAARILNKRPSKQSTIDLLARNWHQIKNSDQVVAVARIHPGMQKVDGGTGWAVAMAQASKTPREINVFNLVDNNWYQWNGAVFKRSATPVLRDNFAGIGSREITPRGTQAIREVYENTKKNKMPKTQQQFDHEEGMTRILDQVGKTTDLGKLRKQLKARREGKHAETASTQKIINALEHRIRGYELLGNLKKQYKETQHPALGRTIKEMEQELAPYWEKYKQRKTFMPDIDRKLPVGGVNDTPRTGIDSNPASALDKEIRGRYEPARKLAEGGFVSPGSEEAERMTHYNSSYQDYNPYDQDFWEGAGDAFEYGLRRVPGDWAELAALLAPYSTPGMVYDMLNKEPEEPLTDWEKSIGLTLEDREGSQIPGIAPSEEIMMRIADSTHRYWENPEIEEPSTPGQHIAAFAGSAPELITPLGISALRKPVSALVKELSKTRRAIQ